MTALDILAISGSLRRGSYNSALVRAAQRHAPDGMDVTIYDALREVPPYDQDRDTEDAVPATVTDLRARIKAADGLLIATPEYNYGVPGVLKNALDWASRPSASSSLLKRPIAIMGAAPTNFGSVRAQLSLRQLFLWTDSRVVTKPEVAVFKAQDRVGPDGEIADETTIGLVEDLLRALGDLVATTAAERELHATAAR
jgi:chromate reductase